MSQQITLVKDNRELVIQTVRTAVGNGGGVTALSVVAIDDPSAELNAIAGAEKGELILCYQAKATADDWTLYAWDDAASEAELVPYSVDGLTGRWQAIGGRYHYNGIDTPGEMILFATTTKEIDVGATTLENTSTGLFKFDSLTIGTPTTDVDIGAGAGHVLNSHTDPDNPTYTHVEWSAQPLTISNLVDGTITWVYMDSDSNPQQQTTSPTPKEVRENIFLGFLIVFGGAIVNIANAGYVAANPAAQLAGLFDAIGTINLSISISNGGVDLSLASSGGVLVARGINFDGTEDGRANPNDNTIAAANPERYRYATQSVASGVFVTVVDPANYDVGGTITPIPGSNNRATNQRVWMTPDGVLGIQYGTVFYNSVTDAISGSTTEEFINHSNIAESNAVLVTTMSIRKGATNLSLPADVRFLPGSKFGEAAVGGSGQSVTSLQQAYNNSTDGTVLTDTTRTAVKLQRGTALDTDDVLEILNGAGTQTLGVDGNGVATPSAVGLGGHVLNDVLISSDALSTSDVSFVTAGYVDSLYLSLDGTSAMTGALVVTPDGSAAAPAVQVGGEGNGLYSSSANVLDFASGGVSKFRMASIALRSSSLGSEATPVYSTSAHPGTGAFFVTSDIYAISTGGTEAVRWDASQVQINAAGIQANADADETFIFGRTRISSPVTDRAQWGHFDMPGATQTALQQTNTGQTLLRSATGQSMFFALGASVMFSVFSTNGLTGILATAPAFLNENSSAINPVICPTKTDLLSGLGGVASNPSMITASVERQQWSANTTGLPVSSIYRLAVAAESPDNDLDVIGLNVANETPALVGAQVQNSPAIAWEAQHWDVDAAVSRVTRWTAYVEALGTVTAGVDNSTWKLDSFTVDGGWGTQIAADNDNTAGNTRFMLYDVDNGTLERVSVGAADSGGTNFKVLRIAN